MILYYLGNSIFRFLGNLTLRVTSGTKVKDIIREYGISEQTYYRWKSKYGGLDVNEARRLKTLEEENSKLKRLVADKELQILGLKEALGKKY